MSEPLEDGTPCDDMDDCTTKDGCNAGACMGVAIVCGDGYSCSGGTCQCDTTASASLPVAIDVPVVDVTFQAAEPPAFESDSNVELMLRAESAPRHFWFDVGTVGPSTETQVRVIPGQYSTRVAEMSASVPESPWDLPGIVVDADTTVVPVGWTLADTTFTTTLNGAAPPSLAPYEPLGDVWLRRDPKGTSQPVALLGIWSTKTLSLVPGQYGVYFGNADLAFGGAPAIPTNGSTHIGTVDVVEGGGLVALDVKSAPVTLLLSYNGVSQLPISNNLHRPIILVRHENEEHFHEAYLAYGYDAVADTTALIPGVYEVGFASSMAIDPMSPDGEPLSDGLVLDSPLVVPPGGGALTIDVPVVTPLLTITVGGQAVSDLPGDEWGAISLVHETASGGLPIPVGAAEVNALPIPLVAGVYRVVYSGPPSSSVLPSGRVVLDTLEIDANTTQIVIDIPAVTVGVVLTVNGESVGALPEPMRGSVRLRDPEAAGHMSQLLGVLGDGVDKTERLLIPGDYVVSYQVAAEATKELPELSTDFALLTIPADGLDLWIDVPMVDTTLALSVGGQVDTTPFPVSARGDITLSGRGSFGKLYMTLGDGQSTTVRRLIPTSYDLSYSAAKEYEPGAATYAPANLQTSLGCIRIDP